MSSIQLLLSLSSLLLRVSSQNPCQGDQFRRNISAVPGDSVFLDCSLSHCPPPARITWLRSDSPEEVRYPLVSNHPVTFTLENAMPEESGWYICETDLYVSFVYINISLPPPPPSPGARSIVSLMRPAPPERKTETPAPGNQPGEAGV